MLSLTIISFISPVLDTRRITWDYLTGFQGNCIPWAYPSYYVSPFQTSKYLDFHNTCLLSAYNSEECCTFWYLQSIHRLWIFFWYWNTPLQPLSVAHSPHQRAHGMNNYSNAKVERLETTWTFTQACLDIISSAGRHLYSTLLPIGMATYSFTSQAR